MLSMCWVSLKVYVWGIWLGVVVFLFLKWNLSWMIENLTSELHSVPDIFLKIRLSEFYSDLDIFLKIRLCVRVWLAGKYNTWSGVRSLDGGTLEKGETLMEWWLFVVVQRGEEGVLKASGQPFPKLQHTNKRKRRSEAINELAWD